MAGTLTYVMCSDAVTCTKATKVSRGLKLHASDRQETFWLPFNYSKRSPCLNIRRAVLYCLRMFGFHRRRCLLELPNDCVVLKMDSVPSSCVPVTISTTEIFTFRLLFKKTVVSM